MAFDWNKVEGYREDMSAEEKLELLNNMPEPDVEESKPTAPMISKAQFDKVSSELASVKKQLRSRMTDEEQREAERLANEESMRNELEELRKERDHDKYVKHYITLGYDEALAEDAALARIEKDDEALFAVERKHKANYEKELRAKILKETPVPPAGDTHTEDTEKKKALADLRKAMGLPPI